MCITLFKFAMVEIYENTRNARQGKELEFRKKDELVNGLNCYENKIGKMKGHGFEEEKRKGLKLGILFSKVI